VPEEVVRLLFGTHDGNLRRLEKAFGVALAARGEEVAIEGADPARVRAVEHLLRELSALLERGYRFRSRDVETAVRVLAESPDASLSEFFESGEAVAAGRRVVAPRSLNQRLYLRAMVENDLVVCVGPAGTGKTYLAVARAASALLDKQVRRIVLVRPAVEAGEKLGFLPGDLAEKVNPYLRPLYDSLYDILGFDQVARMVEREVIEIAPLAFMRGRTLNDAFIILDEAQNTTPEQMKMFLTRIGFGSKAVVTGDITQVDLPAGRESGLRVALRVLHEVEGIGFLAFTQTDVVRHELVQRIVTAYERFEARHQKRDQPPGDEDAR
jgi:phosphate starvation-inducible PhoH-like protein